MLSLKTGMTYAAKWTVVAQIGSYKRSSDTVFTLTLNRGMFNSLNDVSSNELFKFYPNPALQTLFIEGGQVNIESAAIIDIAGKEIAIDMKKEGSRYVVDVNAISTGVYFIRIIAEDHSVSYHKWIKQ